MKLDKKIHREIRKYYFDHTQASRLWQNVYFHNNNYLACDSKECDANNFPWTPEQVLIFLVLNLKPIFNLLTFIE